MRRCPHCGQPAHPAPRPDLRIMEQEIYALNRRIRAVPGDEVTDEWLALMAKHRRLLERYHRAGGRRL